MNNIFRILLLGALPLAAFPVIQASAQEPDIQTLLSAERSSFISGKARDILCRKLGTANLDTDKIRAMAHAPQVALLCHLYQFFSTAENGEPFTQHELKDGAFRKWPGSLQNACPIRGSRQTNPIHILPHLEREQ